MPSSKPDADADFLSNDEAASPSAERSLRTEPIDEVAAAEHSAAAETNAQSLVQKTLSESGQESAQLSTSQRPQQQIVAGMLLGPYQIVRKVGQGGMGAVYEARHTKLKKTVAVKVLPSEMMKTPALIARFEREMEAVGQLDDPHIVRAMDAGEFNGTHFLVMEFVDGTDLSQLVKAHGPLSVPDACHAIQQAARGLQHAHEYGLVHRDIKPSNLLMAKVGSPSRKNRETAAPLDSAVSDARTLTSSGTAFIIKILDLGLARLSDTDDSQAGLTSTGQVLGTPDYMAPEQWDDTHSVDGRADLYSLGCTLFFLLTGKAPFSADKPRSVLHLMKAHVDEEIPDLSARCPQVPAEVNAIYRRLLAKKPEERFATAAEVITALEPFAHQHDAPASGSSPHHDAPTSAPPSADQDARTVDLAPEPLTSQPTVEFPGEGNHSPAEGNHSLARRAGTSKPSSGLSETLPVAASTAEPDHTRARRASGGKPSSTTRQRVVIAAAFVAFAVLAGIIIKITKKDGTTLEVTVPDDTQKVEITESSSSPRPSPLAPNPSSWHGWPADAPSPAIAPFDAEQAQQHQEAWAKYLGVPVEYTNSFGMKFRLIPPGEFMMGSTAEEIAAALKDADEDKHKQQCLKSEAPQHKVILTQPIYLGVNEVTQAEYEKVMGVNPSHFAPMGMGKAAFAGLETAEHPVEMVSWNDAAEFCAKLSQQEKLKPFYFRVGETITPLDGTGYRLPSEAEWEFACRAGTATKYWIGDKDDDLVRAGWFGGNAGGRTHAAGELKANPFGLSDMHGNVWEWVQDGWDATYYGQFPEKPAINPNSPFSAGSLRVVRGGYWHLPASRCRSSDRHADVPTSRGRHLGFRVSLVAVGSRVGQALKVTGPAMPKAVATTPSAPASDPIDFAAEREAAERLLKLKKGTIYLANEDRSLFQPLQDPLPQQPFHIHAVRLLEIDLTDADLAALLAGCRGLHSLELAVNPKLTAAGLASLGRQPSLWKLDLNSTACARESLEFIANYPKLAELRLLTNDSRAGVLQTLPSCPNLTSLYTPALVGDEDLLTIVRQCPGLTELWLADHPVQSLAPLSKLQKLRHFIGFGTHLTDAGIAVLAGLPNLDNLMVDSPDRPGIQRLGKLSGQLRELNLRNQDPASPLTIDPTDWTPVTEFPNLEKLFVDHAIAVDAAALQAVAKMARLKAFGIGSYGLTDAHRATFRKYTNEDIAAFRAARPDIELNIDGKQYPSNGWPLAVVKQLDETDPLPKWELPGGSPLPVVAPCSPEDAAALQQKWAEHLKRPVVEADKLDMKFALIPPGEFRKIFTRPRDPAIEPDMPVRRFRITKPYALSTTEVTWDQFRQFVEATGYQTEAETNGLGGRDRAFKPDPKINWRTPGWKPAPNEPVTQVTPRDAEAFCAWLTDPHFKSQISNLKSEIPNNLKSEISNLKSVYRLPTEAEWVHACRAGSVHKHVVGPEPGDLADYAWTQEFLDPNPQASPLHLVAQKKPNPFGLHDTLGNVWEYTTDWLPVALSSYLTTNDPRSHNGHMNLGGGWFGGRQSRTHPDYGYPGGSSAAHVGFRVLKQFDGEPLPGPLDRPLVLRAGQPLSVHALVPRPEKIPGLQSWSIELAGTHRATEFTGFTASPKGDLIATSSAFGKISLWDRDGNYQRALVGHENHVTSLDFSADGRWLASGDIPGAEKGTLGCTVRIWDVTTGALHALIPSPVISTHGLKFSPDSKQLAVSTEGQYKTSFFIFDLATGQIRLPVTEEQRGRGLAWSPDSTKLASSASEGGNPSRLRIWDAATLKVLQDVECPLSASLEWSPDGQWLAMLTADGKVAIRDANTLVVTKIFASNRHGYSKRSFAWLPDSKRLVVGEQGVFDATTGEEHVKFGSGDFAYAVAAIDEGKQAVFESNGRLHFYDTSTGQKLREGKERSLHGGLPTLAPNGREVFCPLGRNRVEVFDATTGERNRQFELPSYDNASVSASPDSSLIAVGEFHFGDRPTISLVDSLTGAKRHELSHPTGNVKRVAWSPDGKWLATGATDKLVRVWNVATGKIEHELAGHMGTIWSLAWSPDGTRLASAAEDKTVRLWNPLAGKLVATYDQFPEAMNIGAFHHSLAWTADSRRLWIALSQHIVPLDVETGTFGPQENFSNGGSPMFLNTSPDGQRLLVREHYGWTFVRGRDAQDRRLLGQHLGQTAQWHPDSRRFLGWEYGYGTVGFDVETNRRLGLLFPWLTGDHWLCLGPTGHYRGSPGVEDQFVYVAMLPDGSQRTYTPAEFAKTFGWQNDPEKAELLGK